jgi:transketolase
LSGRQCRLTPLTCYIIMRPKVIQGRNVISSLADRLKGDISTPVAAPARSLAEMEATAKKLRRHIIQMIGKASSGHVGGSLSSVEIVTALYFHVMRHQPENPCWPERDRFILSKGHAAPLLYAALAEAGYLPVEELTTLRQMDSRLQGHTDCNLVPGIEMSAGALGMGLSFGIGTALAARLNSNEHRTYVLLGDGECEEGQVWEAAMAAAHFKLDKLVVVVDNNEIQLDGWVRDIMSIEPFVRKWEAFGWHVIEANGHNLSELVAAFEQAKLVKGKPTVIIAHTVKGKGVSFMENNPDFHGKAPTAAQVEMALKELA